MRPSNYRWLHPFEVRPGQVALGEVVVWECTTLDNESEETQVAETSERFAKLLARAIELIEALE